MFAVKDMYVHIRMYIPGLVQCCAEQFNKWVMSDLEGRERREGEGRGEGRRRGERREGEWRGAGGTGGGSGEQTY